MNDLTRRAVPAMTLFGLLVALDLGTKHLLASRFMQGVSRPLVPGFLNLTLVHNRGAAFGIGSQWSTVFFIIVSIVAIAVVVYLFLKLKPEEGFSRWGLTFILSGAIGNLVDRIRLGYVVDFIDVYFRQWHWPAFNVADSAITVGAVLFALDLLRAKKSEKA